MGWGEAKHELSRRNGGSDVENTGLKGNESKWTWEPGRNCGKGRRKGIGT